VHRSYSKSLFCVRVSTACSFGSTTSFSVALYVKATTVVKDSIIATDKGWGGWYSGWCLSWNSGGVVQANLGSYNGAWGRTDLNTGVVVVADGTWRHVALVVDRSAVLASLYMDGALVSTASLPSVDRC
jgi:hypothetical protein